MSHTLTPVNTAANGSTFSIAWTQLNACINVISNEAVTCNTQANGGLTTGNGWVEGIFGARNLCANTIRGGDVGDNNAALSIISNVTMIPTTSLTIGNSLQNVFANSSVVLIDGVSVLSAGNMTAFKLEVDGTSATLVDFWSKLTQRCAQYTVTITDLNNNNYQAGELLVLHDGGATYQTEYATVYSNTYLGDYSSNANATHVRVYLTSAVSNVTVSGLRASVVV